MCTKLVLESRWHSSCKGFVCHKAVIGYTRCRVFDPFVFTGDFLMKKTMISVSLAAALGAVAMTAVAQTAAPAAAPASTPDWTVTGNATLISDYRFRGFTQTNFGPALQGGFDVAHSSGFYLGNWNSNVAQALYNGASLETDLYGGFKGEVMKDLGFDVGVLHYLYAKSGKDYASPTVLNARGQVVPGPAQGKKIDNTEIYGGLTYGPFSGKLFYATGDYFKTAALFNAPKKTDGTTYLDLSYSQEFSGITLGAHYGLLSLKNNRQDALTLAADAGGAALPKTVGDYKLSAGMDVGGGYIGTVAVYGTTKKGYFATDLLAAKSAGKTSLVLSIGKTF
jgi:uncharacterized protein (TIGR02001 family)